MWPITEAGNDLLIPIAYYISGHGYGHAVRSARVIRSLKKACPEAELHIRTAAPRWLLQDLPFPIAYERQAIDVGILQKDSLEMDLEETVRACRALHARAPELIEENLAFVRRERIGLIVGDIPPLCFEIASRASLPSVAVTNFTWDWIYRAYGSDLPSFLPLVQQMEGCYRKASLCLSLPFSCDLEIFPRLEPIPLIARLSALSREEARGRFGLPQGATVVLMSFGGFGLERLSWEALKGHGDFFFVTTGRDPRREKNFAVLAEAQSHYEDLVRAADLVVSKPGYGIVADVIAHRVPMLYTSRGPFPEYPYLVEALRRWATCEFIPQEDLLAGDLGPYLGRLLDKEKNWPDVPLNGAEVAAERILELI